ncbi:MAG: DUF6268 family outer membrane beta-barrel protein [Verrucomicrobiae bacterium]|nr:DUF6268 family outer membrane beta-barrel protein [Verrucomicrobiae bacterium]
MKKKFFRPMMVEQLRGILIAAVAFLPFCMAQAQGNALAEGFSVPGQKETKEKPKNGGNGKKNAEMVDDGVSFEVKTEYSYTGTSKTRSGAIPYGNVKMQSSAAEVILNKHLSEGVILRGGAGWDRYSFGLPEAAPLPATLQSTCAVLGSDIELNEEWLMRLEIRPGVYSDYSDITFEDVNCPAIIGASYLVDKDLQWFFGLSADPFRNIPVMPGGGVRWKFANQWTLMFLMPRPRIEYEITEKLTAYFGGDIKGGSFRISRTFGDSHGQSNTNSGKMDYMEARVGPGMSWKIIPGMTLDVSGGYMLFREFHIHPADVKSQGQPAPYGQISLSASF